MRETIRVRTARARRALRHAATACAICTVAACGDTAASERMSSGEAGAVDAAPRTVVAVVDFSGSQTTHAVADARQYLEKVVNGLGYGDRFVLLEMYRTGSRDSVGQFVQDMPQPIRREALTSYDRRQLEAARRGVLNALPIFFDPSLVRSVRTTDLLTTMHIAAEHLGDARGRQTQLLLLSDMLQSTPAWEFEGGRRMPPDAWLEQQQRDHLLPALAGTCVIVIGADHTTPAGQRVRHFWNEYFAAAGAHLEPRNYRLRAPTDVVEC